MCSPGYGWWGSVVVVGSHGERFLGVRGFCVCCVYGSARVVGVWCSG